MYKKIKNFDIPHLSQLQSLLIILGANFLIERVLWLETWFFDYPTVELYPIPIFIANLILAVTFIFFLIRNFDLKVFESIFTKRKIVVFLMGIVGVGLLFL